MRSCALPWGLPRRAMACTSVPRVRSSRPAIAGWIGRTTRCIREREARSASFLALCAEARIPKGSGPFSFLTSTGLRIGADPRSVDRTPARGGRSLTTCCEATSVLAGGLPRNFCGCSSVGRARPRHASWWLGPRVRDSSSAPLRVCPFTPLPRDMVLAVRDVRDPRPEPRAARHHIRRDARVWAQPKWISIAFVAQQAFSRWIRGFESHTRRQHKEPSSSSRFGGGNRPQRLGGAGTRDRMDALPRQLSGQSAGLSSRKSRVRIPHGAPYQFAEIAQQVERRVEGARVGGSIPSLGTRQSEPR